MPPRSMLSGRLGSDCIEVHSTGGGELAGLARFGVDGAKNGPLRIGAPVLAQEAIRLALDSEDDSGEIADCFVGLECLAIVLFGFRMPAVVGAHIAP